MKKIISMLMCVFLITLSTNVFAQESITDIKARIKHQKETSKYEMTDTIAVKPVNPDDCEKILKEALNGYEYVITKYHDAIKTYTVKFNSADDADKAVDILNERDDIVYAQNDYYGGGQGAPVRPSETVLPQNKEELSKTYEMGILNQNGIIVGYPDGDLHEGDEITRAEFAAVLCRAMGCEDETENDNLKQKNYFPDVTAEHWAAGYVNFAYENGAISGFPDGNFYPEEKVTNEQVIKMLIGAWGYSDEAEKNGGYPNGYVKVAKEHRILDTIEFNYKNASKRWVASVFVYGVLSMPTENPKVKQPIKTEIISVEQPREENDNYVEHPEEILRNVSNESSFYERTTFEQRVPTKHLPIKMDGKAITNVWFRDFSIGINIVGAKQEGFHADLAVGESVDVSDFANGEYNIIVGYNDGKVDDYSFGKIAISDESVELAGFMHRYTNLRDVIQFDQTVTEVELSNESIIEDMPFELKATSDGKGGYVLCINYSGSLTGEQKFSYAINDIDESLNYKVDESERFTAPMTSIEPIVIHSLKSGTEYCLQVEFNDKHIEKSIKGTLTVDNNDFLFKGNWLIATMK